MELVGNKHLNEKHVFSNIQQTKKKLYLSKVKEIFFYDFLFLNNNIKFYYMS